MFVVVVDVASAVLAVVAVVDVAVAVVGIVKAIVCRCC